MAESEGVQLYWKQDTLSSMSIVASNFVHRRMRASWSFSLDIVLMTGSFYSWSKTQRTERAPSRRVITPSHNHLEHYPNPNPRRASRDYQQHMKQAVAVSVAETFPQKQP